MSSYVQPQPGDPVHGLLASVIENQYPVIHKLSPALTIGILFAVPAKEGQPALKHRGWPCLSLIKVVSERDRAAGEPDVLLILNGARWPKLTPRRREALIAHELEHLEFPKYLRDFDEDGHDRYISAQDGLGRPKVKCRPHDFEVGGFDSIVERYGDDAPEKVVFEGIRERLGQLSFLDEVDRVAELDREADHGDESLPTTNRRHAAMTST